ncbi:putative protein kinase [Leptomonas seymouri]|uniref:non-specific serine/threonine protein kinase n=1 Tax=Leptomonas seymouri TaxID=5684 RepID=A0A0N1I6I4_LEPSE|nr:putative protein kinase [Leptomonas seymouri]|eukprot:KPI88778.1 putative protein kinase [Leptomonas seymouri]
MPSSNSSCNSSSSDDGIFTEPVNLKKKVAQRRTPIHTTATSITATTTAESSPKTVTRSPTSRDAPTTFAATPAESRLTSSTAPSIVASGDTNISPSTEGKNSNDNTTSVELSVAALKAISGSVEPATQRNASTNTEASSEDRRRQRHRRRPVGRVRPPLHKRTTTSVSAPLSGCDVATLSPPTNTLFITPDKDAHDSMELMQLRSNVHSVSTGDIITASSSLLASNEQPVMTTQPASSTVSNAASMRTRQKSQPPYRHPYAGGSALAMCSSSQPPGLALPVAAHLLSDEAYLDTFKIPALIAQLSLSLMAAKPVDLRTFTRDWLADRLVSEDEGDDQQGSASANTDFVNSSSVAVTSTGLLRERGSTRSFGVGASSSMSDAVSNHSSNRNVEVGSSGTTSLHVSKTGAPKAGSSATAAAAASGRRVRPYSRTRSAPNLTRGESAERGNEEDDEKDYDVHARFAEVPSELIAVISEQPTLMGVTAKAQRGTERRKAARRKASTRGRTKEWRRRKSEQISSVTRASVKHDSVSRAIRRTSSRESNSRSDTSFSPRSATSRAATVSNVVQSSPHGSSPNTSIMKTMPPVEVSIMNEAGRTERARMLADIAEAARLHAAEGPKEAADAGKQSGGDASAGPAREADGAADHASRSASSSSSSSDSFFDSPSKGSLLLAQGKSPSPGTASAPLSAVSFKDEGGSHETSQRRERQSGRSPDSMPFLLPAQHSKGSDQEHVGTAHVASLTEAIQSIRDSDDPSSTTTKVRPSGTTENPLGRQITRSTPGSTATPAPSHSVAITTGATAQTGVTPAVRMPTTLSPEPVAPVMVSFETEGALEVRTPTSSQFQTPESSTTERIGQEHHPAAADNTSREVMEKEGGSEAMKAAGSSSNSSEGEDNAHFAMFAPLLAVDQNTNEVIDYRNTASGVTGQIPYPGAPPLSIPTGGATRITAPPLQSTPPNYLVDSISVGNSCVSMANTSCTVNSSTAAVGGGTSYLSPQTHAPTTTNAPLQFLQYAPRGNSAAFSLLPTPLLADMVGGNGPANSSFGRRGAHNSSFGRRSGAASVSALARHHEHAATLPVSSFTPPPFLARHEPSVGGTTSHAKPTPSAQLAEFPKVGLGFHGVNTMNNASRVVSGAAASSSVGAGGVSDSLLRTTAGSLAASRAATPQGVEERADAVHAEFPSSSSQSLLVHGKPDSEEKEQHYPVYNGSGNAGAAGSSRLNTAQVPCGPGANGSLTTTPPSTTLKPDVARRLSKLMSQLPASKYAAAIVFLEGLMSSSSNGDDGDASGSDVMSTTTTTVGATSTRCVERFAIPGPLPTELDSVSMSLSDKPFSPTGNNDATTHAWPMPTCAESGPLGSMPIHCVSSFSEILSRNPSLSGGAGIVDSLSKTDAMDPAKKSAAAIAAAKATGSASVEAIVRDALSQSVLRTLPPTHSGTENPSAASCPASSSASLKNDLPAGVKEYTSGKTVSPSLVRPGAKSDLSSLGMLTNVTSTAAAAAGTEAGAAARSPTKLRRSVNPDSLVSASIRSSAPLSQPPSEMPVARAPSFYKKPSGNDLFCLCPSPRCMSRDYSRRGSSNLPAASVAFAIDDTYGVARKVGAATMPPSPMLARVEQKPARLQRASSLSNAVVSFPAATTATTAAAEECVKSTQDDAAAGANATGAAPPTSTPATTAASATQSDAAETKETAEEVIIREMESSDAGGDVKSSPDAPPGEHTEHSVGVPQASQALHLPPREEAQATPSIPSPPEQVSTSEPKHAPQEPERYPRSPLSHEEEMDGSTQVKSRSSCKSSSDIGNSRGGMSSASRSCRGDAENPISPPAGSKSSHGMRDENNTGGSDAQDSMARPGFHFFASTPKSFSHDSRSVQDAATGPAVGVKPAETSVLPAEAHCPTMANIPFSSVRSEAGCDSSSNASPLLRSTSKLRHQNSSQEASRDIENRGSWLEALGQSSTGEVNSPTSRYRNHWLSSSSFCLEGRTFSNVVGTNSGVGLNGPPPLPNDSLKHFDDDVDLGGALRNAVMMAAAVGSRIPLRGSTMGGSFSVPMISQSFCQLPESLASVPFSARRAIDSHRLDLSTSPPSFGHVATHSPGYLSEASTGAAAAVQLHPRPHHETRSSMAAGSGNGGNEELSSAIPVLAPGNMSPFTALVSSSTLHSLSPSHSPAHEPMATSSVAAAMNSFLSRESHVAPQEVEVVREAVARFDAFAALDETQLETLVRTMSRVELAQGQTMVHEGDPTLEKLLLVVSGKLSLSRKGLVTRSFTRGQFYGEMEMSYHVEHSRVTLAAAIPTVVYALTKADYQKLVMHEKDARRYMFLQYVNQCELFKGLSPSTKMRLADSFRVCRLHKGAKLAEQGAPVQWMYLIMSGTVRVKCKPPAKGVGVSPKGDHASFTCTSVTADDIPSTAATNPSHSIAEVLGPASHINNPATLTSASSVTQGRDSSSLIVTTLSSPPFTPFHRSMALTLTPEGKSGTGVHELLQLAESSTHPPENRKNSGSSNTSPLLKPGSQPDAPQLRLGSGSHEENNSSSHEESNSGGANRNVRFLSIDHSLEDTLVPTPTLGKSTPTSQSEDRSVATKENGTPQQFKRRNPKQYQHLCHYDHGHYRHCDPEAFSTPGSLRARAQSVAISPGFTSLSPTVASLDLSALQRCASPSSSMPSAKAKRSISVINAGCSFQAAKSAFIASADSGTKPEETLVVEDRSSGQLVNEPEFVFKCKGLFTAVATTSVQAARISRLHFEAIMSRRVVEELKRSMLLSPGYNYFELVVPEELKQEMRRMLLRLNISMSTKRRSHFTLPPPHHRGSNRGENKDRSMSRVGPMMSNSNIDKLVSSKHLRSPPPSATTSPMLTSQMPRRYTMKALAALPSSCASKNASKARLHTAKGHGDGTGGSIYGGAEELNSALSISSTKVSAQHQRSRLHRTAPLESSPEPCSDEKKVASSLAGNAATTPAADNATSGSTAGFSCQYLEAPSVSNCGVYSSLQGTADVQHASGNEDSSHPGARCGGDTGKGASIMGIPATAGRSRMGTRRGTVENMLLSEKRSSTSGSHSRRISARGEIVFSGSRNLYRFPADAMSLNQSIVISVVADGTIIRWNSIAQSVTGYAPFEAIGKSIYDFIVSEEGRQQMREVLAQGTHYAGKWEQYTEQNLQENRVFPFRQNTGLYQVGLALSVVPSNYAKTAEVLLLVGREGKYRAANMYASDVARWLEGLMKPQLRQFQRRLMQIESHGWRITSEDALQVKGNLDACLSMVEQFSRFSLLNMEVVNESWRPVRLPALLGRFAVEASAFARQRRHEYYCNIDQVEPKTDIFFDAPQMLAILRLLLADAFMSPNEDEDGNPIVVHAELRVTVVEPQDTHTGSGGNNAGGPVNASMRSTTSSLAVATTGSGTNSNASGMRTVSVPLLGTTSNGLPFHNSSTAAVMLKDHPNVNQHGASSTVPTLRTAPQHPQQQPLHSHEEEASRISTGGGAAADDGGSSGDMPSTSAGNTVAATKRLAMSTTTPNPPMGRTAAMGSSSTAANSSPIMAMSPSLCSSLRRIRFELRDDGPTIPLLRSPEAIATRSMSAGASPNSSQHTLSGAQQEPPRTAFSGESSTNMTSTAELGISQCNPSSPKAAKSTRGAELQQVEKILSNLGGLIYGFTRPEAAGNVVRVELPLLAVPGAGEESREDEKGLTTGGGAPFSGGNRTFTVIVADNDRAHQQQLCQILWSRQHAVVPVTSFRDLMRKLEMNTADILLIDPMQIDIVSDDDKSMMADDPFDEIRIRSARLALVVMTCDFSDCRVQTLLNRQAVVELPKVGSGALVHIAMQEAEQLVSEMRDEEERIELIRRTFTNSSAERHKIGKRIGKGAFGDVYEVEDTLTGGKMAMKCMRLHDGLLADEVVQEILAMTSLKNENIIQYFFCEKESDTQLRLYMELAPGGTLRDKIRRHSGVGLPFEEIVHHLSDICHGLAYVHEQRYVHCDLKTANLLLGARGRTKIGDFGTAKHLAPHQLLYTMVGTPQYMAPEVLTADAEERLGYDFKADIWSLGCVVLEMATGNPPFAHLECAQGMGIIKYLTELADTPDLSPLFSGNPVVYEFVKSCLDIDPKNRPTAQELLHFDILEGAVASQRAERLVKRAEILYKLNKYAAMRADGGGERSFTGGGHGSDDSGRSVHNNAGESGLFYSDDDSSMTEDYYYYDDEDGDLSESSSHIFDGDDSVSASEVDEEGTDYTNEEYDFSSSGSDTQENEQHAAEGHTKNNGETKHPVSQTA